MLRRRLRSRWVSRAGDACSMTTAYHLWWLACRRICLCPCYIPLPCCLRRLTNILLVRGLEAKRRGGIVRAGVERARNAHRSDSPRIPLSSSMRVPALPDRKCPGAPAPLHCGRLRAECRLSLRVPGLSRRRSGIARSQPTAQDQVVDRDARRISRSHRVEVYPTQSDVKPRRQCTGPRWAWGRDADYQIPGDRDRANGQAIVTCHERELKPRPSRRGLQRLMQLPTASRVDRKVS
jgi:hypothetical protein